MSSTKWRQLKPLEWGTFVNKKVKVTAQEKQQRQGWVYTVDPVSASIVLVDFPEKDKAVVWVVMGHAVEEVEVLQEQDEEITQCMRAAFTPQGVKTLGVAELKYRKDSLHGWLEKNRIPVEVEGETLKVANVLTISAPYGAENCSSPNEIILARIQSLVESNPGSEQPANV